MLSYLGLAQNKNGLQAIIIDQKLQTPVKNVVVRLLPTSRIQISNNKGEVFFENLPLGAHLLQMKLDGYETQLIEIKIEEGKILDLGLITMSESYVLNSLDTIITINDSDLNDENSGSESTNSLLNASTDVFHQSVNFNWSQARFSLRGLDNSNALFLINGIAMNKFFDGRPQWGNWGGLNDILKNQTTTYGSSPTEESFGGIHSTNFLDTRATSFRKSNKITLSTSNSNFTARVMGTYASGIDKYGNALVFSVSKRMAKEGYFEGTTFDANSLFISYERQFNTKHSIGFTGIYGMNTRGLNSLNTNEVTNLTNPTYNSYWGYQNDKKRNTRIRTINEPILFLTHYWNLDTNSKLHTTISYQFGTRGTSKLDYQGANSPDPTYYKNLPSYHTSLYENDPAQIILNAPEAYLPGGLGGIPIPNFDAANNPNETRFLIQKQIDWENLYQANSIANHIGDGAKYILSEDKTKDKLKSIHSNFTTSLSTNLFLNAGANFSLLTSTNFKELIDLMGANYYNDISLYGMGEQQQSDLNHPNRKVVKGENFGYHYDLMVTNYNAFSNLKWILKKIDIYWSQSYSFSVYQREGYYKNGYYPLHSFGKSEKIEFDNFGFKFGATYKITGRNFIQLNSALLTKAPSLRNAFRSARMNNLITKGINSEKNSSLDISYISNHNQFKTRLTAYFILLENLSEVSYYYTEGTGTDNPNTASNESNVFVTESLTQLNKKNYGLELGMDYSFTPDFKILLSTAYGEYIYSNNPSVFLNVDATNSSLDLGTAKIKNYRQPNMPQMATSLGLEYRSAKQWFVTANFNYFTNIYLDIAPILRTDNFYKNPLNSNGEAFSEATQSRGDAILKQEKLKNYSLVNLLCSKSWSLKQHRIGLSIGINNLLNTTYKTGGFEQARNSNFRQLNQDIASGTPAFGPKYFYGFGRTFFLNLYYSF